MSTKPDTSEAVELKPCPFCGGRAFKWPAGFGDVASCDDDDCIASDCAGAISEWNTRSTSPSPAVEALVEALRSITMIAGNLPDETLESCGGIHEGRGRALMALNARSIARAALSAYEGKGEK